MRKGVKQSGVNNIISFGRLHAETPFLFYNQYFLYKSLTMFFLNCLLLSSTIFANINKLITKYVCSVPYHIMKKKSSINTIFIVEYFFKYICKFPYIFYIYFKIVIIIISFL